MVERNIDIFFEYAFRQNIGTEAQLTSHISALKSLFGFLIDKKQRFSDLYGYISNPSFTKSESDVEEIKELLYTASYHAEKYGFMLGVRFMAKFMSEAMESAE